MTKINTITIDQKQLEATIKEINQCAYMISDAAILCENNKHAGGRLAGNEPTQGSLDMLFEVVKMAADKQMSLTEHLEGFAGASVLNSNSVLGMFEQPKAGEIFYAIEEEILS